MKHLKNQNHLKRVRKIRLKLKQLNPKALRLIVHRSNKHIYAQIINIDGKMQISASSLELEIRNKLNSTKFNKQEIATIVGTNIANRAINKGINHLIFDRSGYIYHGRIKCLAEAVRISGILC